MEIFPTIHTNFWDAVIAVPAVMILTQIVKKLFKIKPVLIPTIAMIFGLTISIFISHKDNLAAGLFMGWFYGNAAIGNFSSLKTTIIAYKQRKSKK